MIKKIIILLCLCSLYSFASVERAYVAGGCFWCTEHDIENIPGVVKTTSGYLGGNVPNPTYEEVESGTTGHREGVMIEYDTSLLSYSQLIYDFLKTINPTDGDGQFVDRGLQYSPAIFYLTDSEKNIILKELEKIKKEGKFDIINVAVLPFKNFYPAEEYHQEYSKKNPLRYKFYRYRSGRDQFLEKVWGNNK